jgi:hypothetical protein
METFILVTQINAENKEVPTVLNAADIVYAKPTTGRGNAVLCVGKDSNCFVTETIEQVQEMVEEFNFFFMVKKIDSRENKSDHVQLLVNSGKIKEARALDNECVVVDFREGGIRILVLGTLDLLMQQLRAAQCNIQIPAMTMNRQMSLFDSNK